jgi:hypothetical protein
LIISSQIQLPLLHIQNRFSDIGKRKIDVRIHLEKTHHVLADSYKQQWYFEINRKMALLFIRDNATFVVQEGREIYVYPEKNMCEQSIQAVVVGSIFAILLYQRNQLALHASSLSIYGSAAAFLGTTGAGKSTIAGALIAKGHNLISDDVSPIVLDMNPPHLLPGYPSVKIHPETAAKLGFPPEALTPIHENETKWCLSIGSGFERDVCPLKSIFILEIGNERKIQKMTPSEAFKQLICHTIPTMWGKPSDVIHFQQLSQLLEKVPVYKFSRDASLDAILEHAEMIEQFLT